MTTLVMIFCGAICGANLAAGVVNLVHYHHFWGVLNCFVAGCVLGAGVNLHLRRPVREQEYAMEAYEMAQKNLEQVMKVTGAKMDSDGSVLIEIGRYSYKIVPGRIYRIETKGGLGWCSTCLSTCLQTWTMPPPEAVAAVLLLLKNDPTIFDRWCRQDIAYA